MVEKSNIFDKFVFKITHYKTENDTRWTEANTHSNLEFTWTDKETGRHFSNAHKGIQIILWHHGDVSRPFSDYDAWYDSRIRCDITNSIIEVRDQPCCSLPVLWYFKIESPKITPDLYQMITRWNDFGREQIIQGCT